MATKNLLRTRPDTATQQARRRADDQAAREPRPEFIEGGRENTASVQARWGYG